MTGQDKLASVPSIRFPAMVQACSERKRHSFSYKETCFFQDPSRRLCWGVRARMGMNNSLMKLVNDAETTQTDDRR